MKSLRNTIIEYSGEKELGWGLIVNVSLRHSGLQLPSMWCAGHFSGGKWYNQIQRKNRLRGERGQLVGPKLGKGTAGIRRAEERVC